MDFKGYIDKILFKRGVGRSPATPRTEHEGALIYERIGATDGMLYLARKRSGGTLEWVAVIGQPLDATLTALSAFNTNGLLTQTAADTFAGRTITAGANIAVTNGSGVAGDPTVALATNVDVAGTFDVTGATTLDSTLGVAGTSTFTAQVIIDRNGTESFIVRKADDTNVLIVDCTNSDVELRNGATLLLWSGDGSGETFRVEGATGRVTMTDIIVRGGSSPSFTKAAALGSTGAGTITSGSDLSGSLQLIPGGTGITSGTQGSLDFAAARPSGNYAVTITPSNASSRALDRQLGVSSKSTSGVDLAIPDALVSGTTYLWDYIII